MQAIDLLMQEHQIILEKLDDLKQKISTLSKSDSNYLKSFVRFVKEYVDDFHHQKEEGILFEWMIQLNPGMQNGPIHCMLNEHNEGRKIISYVEFLIEKLELSENTIDIQEDLSENLNLFIELLENHISKEDNVLYQMARDLDSQAQSGDSQMLQRMQQIVCPEICV